MADSDTVCACTRGVIFFMFDLTSYSWLYEKDLNAALLLMKSLPRTERPIAAMCYRICELSDFSIKDMKLVGVNEVVEKFNLLADSNVKFALMAVIAIDFYGKNGITAPESITKAKNSVIGTTWSSYEKSQILSIHPSVASRMFLRL